LDEPPQENNDLIIMLWHGKGNKTHFICKCKKRYDNKEEKKSAMHMCIALRLFSNPQSPLKYMSLSSLLSFLVPYLCS
jgi:hypothetical protein